MALRIPETCPVRKGQVLRYGSKACTVVSVEHAPGRPVMGFSLPWLVVARMNNGSGMVAALVEAFTGWKGKE